MRVIREEQSKNLWARDAALLFLGALVYRVSFLLLSPRVLDTADAVLYAESAQRIATEGFFSYNPKIPVLYPMLSAFASLFTPDIEWGCRLVSLLLSSLAVVPVYLLARDLHGRGAALVAGISVCLWPWLADYGCGVGTESAGLFLWLLAVWAFTRAMRRGGAWPVAAALAFFLLHLTRPEGTFLLLAAPVAGVLLCRGTRREYAVRALTYAATALALLALNALYVRALSGAMTVNYRIGFIFDEFDALRFAQTVVETVNNVLPVMLGPVFLVFLGVGLFAQRDKRRDLPLEGYVLAMAGVQWAVSVFVLSPAPRYLMAPIVVLAMWAAAGMVQVARDAAGVYRWGRWLRPLPVAALVVSMLVGAAITLGSEHLGRRPRQPREYKTAGLWMREHLEPGLVFTRKPQVAFYAGMPSTGPVEEDSLEQALERARAAGARYVVVDERYGVAGMRPLLEPGNAPGRLRWVKTFAPYPESRVVVYEMVSAMP